MIRVGYETKVILINIQNSFFVQLKKYYLNFHSLWSEQLFLVYIKRLILRIVLTTYWGNNKTIDKC